MKITHYYATFIYYIYIVHIFFCVFCFIIDFNKLHGMFSLDAKVWYGYFDLRKKKRRPAISILSNFHYVYHFSSWFLLHPVSPNLSRGLYLLRPVWFDFYIISKNFNSFCPDKGKIFHQIHFYIANTQFKFSTTHFMSTCKVSTHSTVRQTI